MARYQPYVEDYDSTVGEAVPLSRKRELRKSGLANSSSSTDEGVSDSGYSSQYSFSSTPMTETPPPKTQTPAPPILRPQTANPHRTSSTPFNRPASKSVSRSASPAVPRNIPNSGARDGREGSPNSTGGSSDCDCPDCKTGVKPSPSSPSILSGAWPLHHGSYHAPSQYDHHRQWSGYQYPMRYDGYSQGTPTDSGMTESSRGSDGGSRRERSSMPPPSRSQSTFQGSISSSVHAPPSSSWSQSSGGYFPYQAASPAPQTPNAPPPLPSYSSSASSMYAPPPLNTAVPAVAARHPLGSPYEYPQSASAYGYPPSDYFGANAVHSTSGSGQSPSDYSAHSPSQSQMNRRNSMRAQASAGAALHEVSGDYTASPHHPQRRPSNRGERPTWYHGQPQFQDVPNRSYSVPPTDNNAISESRRRLGTPQPVPIRARRDSGSQGSSGLHSSRLGPSSLAHSMESCAIADDPPYRSSSTNHHASPRGHYDVHGALARRDPGTLMQPSHYSSSSSRDSGNHGYDKEEFVSLTVPESESDSFTMRYPAGIPVKLQLNGGNAQRISLGHRDKNENVEMNIAYKYVQQRQQQVHAQLQYGAGQLEYGDRRANGGDYHGYHRRESMTGA